MCSIFGVFDIKTDAVELRKKALELSRLMRHRGPDWSGIYACDNAILAHERLSIVDVNAGAQPLYNMKKTHILAVNGEIYNHQAIATSSRPVPTAKLSSRCIRKKDPLSSMTCKGCSLLPCTTASRTPT